VNSATVRKQLVASLQRVLRPIVRQAIAHGVPYSVFARLLKRVYVEVADESFPLSFKRQTDSRVALLTGITRRDIAALRGRHGEAAELAEVGDPVATFAVGRWMAGPPYATPDGKPRRLRYESDDPKAPTFSHLVRSLSGDLPVRAVLDELIRVGSVRLDPAGEVELLRQAFIPASGVEGKIAMLGRDPAEIYSTISHNIEDPAVPWLQRRIAYDNIGSDALERLRDEAREVGEEFVRRANALLSSYDRDRRPDAPGGARSRVAVGVYYYEEGASAEPPERGPNQPGSPPGRIQKRPGPRKSRKP
jgi:hypothetical protein